MKPLTRRERIEALLDHWPDFFDVPQRDTLAGEGNGWRLSAMSHHPSVVELARALEALREFAPTKFAHLCGFYSAPYRTFRHGKVTKDKHGRRVTLKGDPKDPSDKTWTYGRDRVVPGWVRLQKVRDAVELVAQDRGGESRPWCFRGEPFLPAPLLEQPRERGPKVAA